MKSAYERIAALADLRGLSGRENAVGEAAAEQLRQYVPDAAYRDGSVIAHLGQNPAKPTLLLCAHLDQVGFLVTGITPEGFLRIGAVGGIDHRLLLGQPVTVTGKGGTYPGVISILPPHLLTGDQAVPEDAQLCVDLGFASAEALADKVVPGDAVYYGTTCKKLQNQRMTGSALDDRCCVAALLMTAEILADAGDLPCNVTFVFSGQEERSGRGAKLAAANESADEAIAVDVTFGLAHGEDPHECMTLGKGPAIGISPVLSQELSEALTAAAKRANIAYQLEIMNGSTGTDADSLALAPEGCRAGTVSVPLRNMHTPVEVIDMVDVAETAHLLAEYAKGCGAE
ncbi:MAG TPA: cellulase [Ruminococcus sp.]|nr:cellulase [Ruminococcus sp.]